MASALSPQIRILDGGEHRLLTDVGRVDPSSLSSYREHGGYSGLERAITRLSPEEVIDEIDTAGLRGRGGAGFPTAEKWTIAREAAADRKIVVANLMAADPSALGDRALAEGNPHLVVEGALIAAYAAGASEAIIAVRRDWTAAIERLKNAVREVTDAHLAGYLVLGTDTSIQLSVWEGSGAYVAGEETALISALAGDRGMPLIRPPYPARDGLWGAPTLVQNAETLAHVAWILAHSPDAFASVGSETSPGTKLVTIMGMVGEPGVLEVPFGTSLSDMVGMAGGGTGTTKAVFVGGPGGGALDAGSLDMAYDYDQIEAAGALIGSGSVLVTDADTCMVDTARFFVDFSAREACGKAVPCRIGTRRLVEALDRILVATPRPNDLTLLRELSRKVSDTALCQLERIASKPILTTLERFGDEYRAHAERGVCLAGACTTDTLPPLLQPLSGLEAAAGPGHSSPGPQ
jgi:NADH-quinone oxidoreductase subunit F